MLNEKLYIGKQSWIVSSTWIQGKSHKTSLNPLCLSHFHTLTQSCFAPLANPQEWHAKQNILQQNLRFIKSDSVYIWGEENVTRKTDKGIFKSKDHLMACESLPDLLLMLPQVPFVGRKGREVSRNNRLGIRHPCGLGFLTISHGNTTLWKSNYFVIDTKFKISHIL